MKIEILGTGCRKCKALESRARQAADQLGVPYELEKVTSIAGIAKRGVLVTPGLAVDGKLKLSGRVPSVKELAQILGSCVPDEKTGS